MPEISFNSNSVKSSNPDGNSQPLPKKFLFM